MSQNQPGPEAPPSKTTIWMSPSRSPTSRHAPRTCVNSAVRSRPGMRRRSRAARAVSASRPVASTTKRASRACGFPSGSRASTPTARSPSCTTRVTVQPSRSVGPARLRAAEEQLVEGVARDLERVVSSGPGRPRRRRSGWTALVRAVDEARPPLDEEPLAHVVEHADGLQHAQAVRQQRLAQVESRVPPPLEQHHPDASRRESRRADGPRRSAARDDDSAVALDYSAVFGGGPSWMRSPMYAPMSVSRMPMAAKMR